MPFVYLPTDLYNRIRSGSVRVNPKSPPEYRFWKQVDVHGPVHPVCGQCWVWTGGIRPDGYGWFNLDNKQTYVHRFSYAHLVRPIPNNMQVLHQCDNRSCVRPEHLFLGTTQHNTQDRVDKGRSAKGEAIGPSVLTEEDVRDVLRRYRRWSHKGSNARELAEEKGVDRCTIRRIISEKTWKHVS